MNYNEEKILRIQSFELLNPFEIYENVIMKYNDELYKADNFDKLFSQYMLCRFLSMKNDLIQYAVYLETILSNSNLTKKQFYQLAYKLVPKQRNGFIKYIKKPEKVEKPKFEINNTENEINVNNSLFNI